MDTITELGKTLLDPADPVGSPLRAAIDAQITSFLRSHRDELLAIGPEAAELLDQSLTFAAKGKRLRPAFCLWGHAAATNELQPDTAVIAAAASLELLHLSALIHDDVMDDSATRRGLTASHEQFASLHRRQGHTGDSTTFGRAGAILLGDLLLMWSDEMLHTAGPAAAVTGPALPYLQRMRTEVTVGQYLDVVAQATSLAGSAADAELLPLAERVVEYKTARYTVVRPLQFGAAMGGGSTRLQQRLADYASPLGRAFQYRDDLLGVFGDAEVTGKPAGDDLRQGKRTALLAHALRLAAPSVREELSSSAGDPSVDVDRLRQLILATGAVDQVEQMIAELADQARAALQSAEVPAAAAQGLERMVDIAVIRQR